MKDTPWFVCGFGVFLFVRLFVEKFSCLFLRRGRMREEQVDKRPGSQQFDWKH